MQVLDSSDHFILVRDGGVGDALVLHHNGMRHILFLGEAVDVPTATVVVRGMAYVPAGTSLDSPSSPCFGGDVDVDSTSERGEGHAVEVKGSEEVWAWADTLGAMLDCRRRLKVSSACGRSLSHRLSGKLGSHPARTEMK